MIEETWVIKKDNGWFVYGDKARNQCGGILGTIEAGYGFCRKEIAKKYIKDNNLKDCKIVKVEIKEVVEV